MQAISDLAELLSYLFFLFWESREYRVLEQLNQVLLLRAIIVLCLFAMVLLSPTLRTAVIQSIYAAASLSEWLIKMLSLCAQKNAADKTAHCNWFIGLRFWCHCFYAFAWYKATTCRTLSQHLFMHNWWKCTEKNCAACKNYLHN